MSFERGSQAALGSSGAVNATAAPPPLLVPEPPRSALPASIDERGSQAALGSSGAVNAKAAPPPLLVPEPPRSAFPASTDRPVGFPFTFVPEKATALRPDDLVVSALVGETVTHSSALATVTRNCVIIRDTLRGTLIIVAIHRLTGLRKSYATVPVLLVVSIALFVIAAAAWASKQGTETVGPIAALGLLFLLIFFSSSRAAVVFLMEKEIVESVKGSYNEATAVIRAVEHVRAAAKRARSADI